jgi:hypothetical protein
VAFSGGEISPNFGGNDMNAPHVAYALYPGGAPLDTSGMARLTTQLDNKHGRWNSNLVRLYVGTAPVPTVGPGETSSSFTVSGVQTPTTYPLSTLQALAQSNGRQTTVTATYMQGSTSVTDAYTGITLWNFLNDDGLILDPTIKNDVLRQYAEVVDTDGYTAIFSLGEIDPDFGGDNDIVAHADTSGQLGLGGADGFARMVVPAIRLADATYPTLPVSRSSPQPFRSLRPGLCSSRPLSPLELCLPIGADRLSGDLGSAVAI